MYAAIFGEFRVKGGSEEVALLDEGGRAVAGGEYLDFGAEAGKARSPDVNSFQRAAGERGLFEADRGVVLAAVGVAFHGGIEEPEGTLRWIENVAREEDASGAGAEDGFGADEGVEEVVKAGTLEVFEEGGGLAAGNHEAVEVLEVIGLAYKACDGTEFREALGVNVEGTLQRKDADQWSGSRMGHGGWMAVWVPWFRTRGEFSRAACPV